MLERARVAGQFPPRPALYDDPALSDALGIPAAEARRIIEAAVPRPVTPVYSQLSSILQVALHRALTRQEEPGPALQEAAGRDAGAARPGAARTLGHDTDDRSWNGERDTVGMDAGGPRAGRDRARGPRADSVDVLGIAAPARSADAVARPSVRRRANYAEVLRDARFWSALGHTAVFVATSVSMELSLGLLLALRSIASPARAG